MKRALLIGIDQYEQFAPLSGCVNDVNAMAPLLESNWDDSPNFHCRSILGDGNPVTRGDVIKAINELLGQGADTALFYFAGHGVGLPNDVCLATSDGDYLEPGVPLSVLLGKAQNSKVRKIVIILDCCHAGGGGGAAIVGTDVAILRDGLAIIAAASSEQIAKETPEGRGQFSSFLTAALDGGAADVRGIVSLAGVYSYMAECFDAWEQRPTFKANVDESFELRRTAPLVPLEHLRRLPKIFPNADTVLQLGPEYERESPTALPEKVAVYDTLSHFRDTKLIELIGADYLYHAAMESKTCRLTPHGRHYRELVTKKLL
jgi:hypothetical protein